MIGESRRGNGDRAGTRVRDAGVILHAPSTEVRFPRAIVRYRLPMSVVFSRLRPAVSSAGWCAIFCSLLVLSRAQPLSLSHSLFFSSAETEQVQIVCIVRILPMILAIILNSARNRESKDSGTGELSSAGSWARDILPSVPFLTSSPSVSVPPEHSPDISARSKSHARLAKNEASGNTRRSPDVYRSRRVSSFSNRIDSRCLSTSSARKSPFDRGL